MSWQATAWAKKLLVCPNGQKITRSEKFLLMMLSECHNPHSKLVEASIAELAADTLTSERHAYRLLQSLQSKQIIRILSGGSAGRLNQYILLADPLTPCQGLTPDTMSPPPLTSDVIPPPDTRCQGGDDTAMSPPSSISILNKEEGETRLQPPLIEVSTNSKWLKEDIWLRDFLHTQAGLSAPAGALEDPAWWTVVSNACGGLGEEFLTREFAKMEAHLIENPLDRPKTPRGWKRFVRGWLCRSDQWERERKSSGGQEKKRLAR